MKSEGKSMKKLLCMVLCLAMVVSMMSVAVFAATAPVLIYNTPVVNDTYEDDTTASLSWTTAHKSSGIVVSLFFHSIFLSVPKLYWCLLIVQKSLPSR